MTNPISPSEASLSYVTLGMLDTAHRRLGLSQNKLAAVVGVAGNTIARWERNEMKMGPSMDRLVRLVVAQVEAPRPRARTRGRS